ncbi:AMP phosphorylase [Candidatus Woesearchaeota archaeon]|nr:AMP phosphorylase [Candidatus Woesearchaeota archaeon]
MKLKVKRINLSTGGPLVAVLNEEDAKSLDLHALERVKIRRLKTKKESVMVIDISSKGVEPGEIGFFDEVFKELDVEEGVHVELLPTPKPNSISYIRKKLDGYKLTKAEINTIVKDIVENRLSETELTYFVSGCYINGLSLKETVYLTNSIVSNGDTVHFGKSPILDKHSIGGVSGRATMVIVPIIAAAGFTMPKTSSRAITSASGTSDAFEILAPVSLSVEKIKEVVKATNGCMVWGGAMNIAGADDKLIRVRHPLSVDPKGMMLASILAKKKAVGATHVLIDIPFGAGSKVATKKAAKELGQEFTSLGKFLKLKIGIVLTDGSQPVGNGVGPALEVADVLNVLKGNGPNDLREKSVLIATKLLEMTGLKKARDVVLDILDSGKAYAKFMEIVRAQGGRKHIKIPKAKYFKSIKAEHDGVVRGVSNSEVAKLARYAGAPRDKTAGLYIRVKKDNVVKKGDVLFTIYSSTKRGLEYALSAVPHINSIKY